jgi:hypothetical protein
VSVKFIVEVDGEKREVELPDEVFRDLALIASRNGLSLAAALTQAVANEKFLEEQQASGAKLLIEDGKNLRELVRVRERQLV